MHEFSYFSSSSSLPCPAGGGNVHKQLCGVLLLTGLTGVTSQHSVRKDTNDDTAQL